MLINRMIKYGLMLLLMFISVMDSIGQRQDSAKALPSIKVISKITSSDSVLIRWAPTDAVTWQLANKYGYIIERYTISRNDQRLKVPERDVLVNEPLKPLPVEAWEKISENDDYALVAAQAIYGETFELDNKAGNDITQIVQKSREIEQRYSFALFAADISLNAAKASGVFYLDTDINVSEKYVYKIYTNIPDGIHPMDSGYLFVNPNEIKVLPKIRELKAEFGNKSVLLSWVHTFYSDIYTGYLLEKSLDGKNYETINDLPIVNTESPTGELSRYYFKSDSLAENYKTYHYRIRGVDAFGARGPISDPVSGTGIIPLEESPTIISAEVIDNKSVKVSWEFDGLGRIKSFELERAGKSSGPFQIVKDNLSAETFQVVDDYPNTVNYYRVKVTDQNGESKVSHTFLAQLIDSIPPIQPKGLIGKIDSLGNVSLTWNANKEVDLLGYRIYRANFKSDEVSEITVDPAKDTVFFDQINIKTLTKSIYYKIKAVDQHFNPSDFSEYLELKRPDINPPVSPIFKNVESNEMGITINWVNSSSNDVVNHLLYRRSTAEKGWKLIAVFRDVLKDTIYTDLDLNFRDYYEYTLVAVDDSKLESRPAQPVRGKRIDKGVRKAIEDVFASVDRKNQKIVLAWNYDQSGIERYIIYRAQDDEPVRIYKSIEANTNQFEDEKLTVSTAYTYRLQAVYVNGAKSPLSKSIIVKY